MHRLTRIFIAALIAALDGGGMGQSVKIVPDDVGPGDGFGSALSLDGALLLAGAPRRLVADEVQGAAWLYERSGGGLWREIAIFSDPDQQPLDHYGWSVAIDGDNMMIGAPLRDEVYGYVRLDGEWGLEQVITDNERAYGHVVAIRGSRALIGIPGAGNQWGEAQVFGRAPGAWHREDTLQLENESRRTVDRVAWAADFDGDVLALGMPGDDDRGETSGAVLIYERVEDEWTFIEKVIPPAGAPFDNFGISVAITGERMLVGAYQDDTAAFDAGAVSVLERGETGWEIVQTIIPPDATTSTGFGYTLAALGDRAAVGAIGDRDRGKRAGAVYVYERGPGEWTQVAKLTADDGAPGDLFGFALALGPERLVVGAPRADAAGADSGAVYVFELGP